jgi:hypothetical protein
VAGIAASAGMPVDAVLAALGELMLTGFVERSGSGWRLSESERRATRPRH